MSRFTICFAVLLLIGTNCYEHNMRQGHNDCQQLLEVISPENVQKFCGKFVTNPRLCIIIKKYVVYLSNNLDTDELSHFIKCSSLIQQSIIVGPRLMAFFYKRDPEHLAYLNESLLNFVCSVVRPDLYGLLVWFCTDYKPKINEKLVNFAKEQSTKH
ncbi:hypothetical protein A3Q56_05458 [Intoshia linei]|uniref:Saposin B-type domain-containing protein n=1 Tax=Intoshia linei TaxID=1819745 RepID=A0A177AXS3_9BILA|nr:hypothetical protein A3Q56_05458 [Intoshia linei]